MPIEIVTTVLQMHKISSSLKQAGKKIGFVPTMGFLHQGHLSLIKKSKELSDVTVVSVFVNPSQFAPNEDYAAYPRDFEKDKELLIKEGVDFIFAPSEKEIYPHGFQTYVTVEEITRKLEGEFRPTHFRGVTTVVSILFNCVKPDFAFFGQKDAQQAEVIKQMVSDLMFDLKVIICPIVREHDGLALSSRNIYLSPEERKSALVLYKALKYAEKKIEESEHNAQTVIDNMKFIISEEKNIKVDYIKIVNTEGFREVEFIEQGNIYYILIAARIGKTRLIDNLKIFLKP